MQKINPPLSLCLIGATGLVGRQVALALSLDARVSEVQALVRRPLGMAKIQDQIIEFDQLSSLKLPKPATVFICCLGTTLKVAKTREAFRRVDYDYVIEFARLALREGASRLIVVSSLGADPRSGVFYLRVKGEMERDVRALGLPLVVFVRPSVLLGERDQSRPGEKLAQKLLPWLNPLLVGPLKKFRAVSAAAVAQDICDSMGAEWARNH